ncbi:MAG TPA: prohibitin family protein [Vicinamibacterales bacterium]|nr:prohibitin family protein [Vicinamibacterales bacterium]
MSESLKERTQKLEKVALASETEARRWAGEHDVRLLLAVLAVAFFVVYYWSSIVISIGAGQAGVLWSRFVGTEVNAVYPEGIHFILPIDIMTIYNVRYQKIDRSFDVLAKDGLDLKVDLSIRFRPIEKLLGRLHQEVGPDYVSTVVVPEVGTALRAVIGQYRPEQLYAQSFSKIENDVVNLARSEVRERFVSIDDVLIYKITLPPIVATAIQRKLEAEQDALAMQYRLEQTRQEAERRRLEAQGIKMYQQTLASSLTPQVLQYESIQAALALAKSNNSKIIVLGGGGSGSGSGFPFFFNMESPPKGGAAAKPPH